VERGFFDFAETGFTFGEVEVEDVLVGDFFVFPGVREDGVWGYVGLEFLESEGSGVEESHSLKVNAAACGLSTGSHGLSSQSYDDEAYLGEEGK
jgi:hypothetical protein